MSLPTTKNQSVASPNLLIIAISSAILCSGSTAPPDAAANAVTDRVVAAIRARTFSQSDVRILEHAAEGRLEEADVTVVLSLGISRCDSYQTAFRSDGARAHAYRKLGEPGGPEALRYLSKVSLADVGKDSSGQIWSSCQIALQIALLNTLDGDDAKIAFLRKDMTERNHGYAHGAVQLWAIEELCNRGDQGSLPAIREWFKRAYSGAPGEQQAVSEFAARLEVLSRNSDRIAALAPVLQLGHSLPDPALVNWALSELASTRSPVARREISRFALELAALPPDSATKVQLVGIDENIRKILNGTVW